VVLGIEGDTLILSCSFGVVDAFYCAPKFLGVWFTVLQVIQPFLGPMLIMLLVDLFVEVIDACV